MALIFFTPMMLASAPLLVTAPPPSSYSHETQTSNIYQIAQNTSTYATTMPTLHTNTCNQANGCPNGQDTDLGGSDSTISDFN